MYLRMYNYYSLRVTGVKMYCIYDSHVLSSTIYISLQTDFENLFKIKNIFVFRYKHNIMAIGIYIPMYNV